MTTTTADASLEKRSNSEQLEVSFQPEHTPDPSSRRPLQLYGKMLTFSRLKLHTNDLAHIQSELDSLAINQNSQIPVILDSDVEQNLPALLDALWQRGMQPIGMVSSINDVQAKAQRLAIFPPDGEKIERITSKSSQNIQNLQDKTDMVHSQMLRSGQSINHVGGDLILTNSVNQGAEVITDHNLHIYGRAKGRLVAGATGDKNAKIFCQKFNPSLVSVAGTYCLHDSIPPNVIDKPVQVSYVEGEGLQFQVMNDTTSQVVNS